MGVNRHWIIRNENTDKILQDVSLVMILTLSYIENKHMIKKKN